MYIYLMLLFKTLWYKFKTFIFYKLSFVQGYLIRKLRVTVMLCKYYRLVCNLINFYQIVTDQWRVAFTWRRSLQVLSMRYRPNGRSTSTGKNNYLWSDVSRCKMLLTYSLKQLVKFANAYELFPIKLCTPKFRRTIDIASQKS